MIILIGASASGKTEVAKLLDKLYGIKKVITHTTREMRAGEKRDIDYHFVTKDEFLSLKDHDTFVETTFYNNNFYGSSKQEINDKKVLIVDPTGLDSFIKLQNPHIISFYLTANEATRFNRMLIRGDDIELVKARIANDRIKFTSDLEKKVNYQIDSESMSLLDMAEKIYKLYTNHLKKQKDY